MERGDNEMSGSIKKIQKEITEGIKNKYKFGELVYVRPWLGESSSHFSNDCPAIVNYTYASKFGGDDHDSYGLIILSDTGKEVTESSWYDEWQLISLNSLDDLPKLRERFCSDYLRNQYDYQNSPLKNIADQWAEDLRNEIKTGLHELFKEFKASKTTGI